MTGAVSLLRNAVKRGRYPLKMNRPILGLAALLCSSALVGGGMSPAHTELNKTP